MLHQQTNQGQFPCGNKQALGLHWPHQTYTYDLLCLCVCKTRVTIRWNLLERPQAKHKTLLMLMTPFFPKKVLFYPLGLFLFISTVGLGLAFLAVLVGLFLSQQGATGPMTSPPCTCACSTAKARESRALCFFLKAWQSHLLYFKATWNDLSRVT